MEPETQAKGKRLFASITSYFLESMSSQRPVGNVLVEPLSLWLNWRTS